MQISLESIDAAQYVWCPKIYRNNVSISKNSIQCTKLGKSLKPMSNSNSAKPLPILNAPNLELQLDYAGPFSDDEGKQIYILAAIDRYSKFPSVMLTRSTGAKNIIKFLTEYTSTHRIPKTIRNDQYSGFKNQLVSEFCKNKNIKHIFCPVGDHRDCGSVERTIQTIKQKFGDIQLEENLPNIQDALKSIIYDIRSTKNAATHF